MEVLIGRHSSVFHGLLTRFPGVRPPARAGARELLTRSCALTAVRNERLKARFRIARSTQRGWRAPRPHGLPTGGGDPQRPGGRLRSLVVTRNESIRDVTVRHPTQVRRLARDPLLVRHPRGPPGV
ncbi:hypothetical protein QJS66_06725 [Kocuria rhizophila]|nr:hypothetical protein QJS66_06725 [Kocuria rhizophila]